MLVMVCNPRSSPRCCLGDIAGACAGVGLLSGLTSSLRPRVSRRSGLPQDRAFRLATACLAGPLWALMGVPCL